LNNAGTSDFSGCIISLVIILAECTLKACKCSSNKDMEQNEQPNETENESTTYTVEGVEIVEVV